MSTGAIGSAWGYGATQAAEAVGTATRANPLGMLLGTLFYSPALNEGENERVMQMHREAEKSRAASKTKDVATSRTCDPATNRECKNEEHRGVIQAQEDNYMLVIVTGANWGPQPYPPSFSECKAKATIVRKGMTAQRPRINDNKPLKLRGGDRGDSFQAGADVAYDNLVVWMRENTPTGVPKIERSFYFNGTSVTGINPKLKGINSRRIDFSVKKGYALTS